MDKPVMRKRIKYAGRVMLEAYYGSRDRDGHVIKVRISKKDAMRIIRELPGEQVQALEGPFENGLEEVLVVIASEDWRFADRPCSR